MLRPDGSERPAAEAPPARALKGEVVIDREEIVKTPASGKFRHHQVNAAPIKNADGHILGSVSVVRDITERKRMRTSSAGPITNCNSSPTFVPRPAGTVAHDGQLHIAAGEKPKDQLDPKAHEYIEHALNGGNRMRQLIDDLLAYSRVETTAKESAPVDMKKIVENTIRMSRSPSKRAGRTSTSSRCRP